MITIKSMNRSPTLAIKNVARVPRTHHLESKCACLSDSQLGKGGQYSSQNQTQDTYIKKMRMIIFMLKALDEKRNSDEHGKVKVAVGFCQAQLLLALAIYQCYYQVSPFFSPAKLNKELGKAFIFCFIISWKRAEARNVWRRG